MSNTADSDAAPPYTANSAFFLDVDGTLLELAEHPDAVEFKPGTLSLLRELFDTADGAMALVSGRSLVDLDHMFAPLRLPIAGLHGAERRDAGHQLHYHHHPQLESRFRDKVGELSAFADSIYGLLLEDKGLAVALHYRAAPQHRDVVEKRVQAVVAELGREFSLQRGKMVFEIKPDGKDKGTAIAEFMHEPPFAGRWPVFIGDDVTDEDGFRVVNELGGHSIKVGDGDTRARWRLADANAVLNWLASYAGFLKPEENRI